ncbi:MAG: hypothetical protein WAM40_04880 [Xanthobacteraceae bacterium]
MPRVVANDSTESAISTGQQIADQFKTVRAYYTHNVVSKVLKSGAPKAGIDPRRTPG